MKLLVQDNVVQSFTLPFLEGCWSLEDKIQTVWSVKWSSWSFLSQFSLWTQTNEAWKVTEGIVFRISFGNILSGVGALMRQKTNASFELKPCKPIGLDLIKWATYLQIPWIDRKNLSMIVIALSSNKRTKNPITHRFKNRSSWAYKAQFIQNIKNELHPTDRPALGSSWVHFFIYLFVLQEQTHIRRVLNERHGLALNVAIRCLVAQCMHGAVRTCMIVVVVDCCCCCRSSICSHTQSCCCIGSETSNHQTNHQCML